MKWRPKKKKRYNSQTTGSLRKASSTHMCIVARNRCEQTFRKFCRRKNHDAIKTLSDLSGRTFLKLSVIWVGEHSYI